MAGRDMPCPLMNNQEGEHMKSKQKSTMIKTIGTAIVLTSLAVFGCKKCSSESLLQKNCWDKTETAVACNSNIRKVQRESHCIDKDKLIFATQGEIPKSPDVSDLKKTIKLITQEGEKEFKLYSVKNNGTVDGVRVKLGEEVAEGMFELNLQSSGIKGVVKSLQCGK
jgi:hypothetical protein